MIFPNRKAILPIGYATEVSVVEGGRIKIGSPWKATISIPSNPRLSGGRAVPVKTGRIP